ncbi:MAG: CPXCG motif-containing cysteine-rich protein [Gammaproteobacteria bacterium]|nr:CPXCG motif-containing cysteine-rich protein [Gammaproteobacteria bacterium]
MNDPVGEHAFQCPYCGEGISVVVDTSAAGQAYVEDCEVCCQPIELAFEVDDAGNLAWFSARRCDE